MKWFKFYGQDFQTDPKIGFLNPLQKLMWVNLLCIASQDEEKTGVIKFLTEEHLKAVSGITDNPRDDDWSRTMNTFDLFVQLGLIQMPDEFTIIIPKFNEKQDTNLTDAERAKKYRDSKKAEAKSDERHANVTKPSQKRHARIDKNRIDKNILNNNISNASVAEIKKDLNFLISLFENINPEYQKFYKNKTERKALSEMVDKYGFEKMQNLLASLPEIIAKKYAPRITTPLQLQKKMGELLIFLKQEQISQPSSKHAFYEEGNL